jgi:hypothetical protein
MVYGLWFMVYGLWFMVYGLWLMIYGLWFMVDGLRIDGSGLSKLRQSDLPLRAASGAYQSCLNRRELT